MHIRALDPHDAAALRHCRLQALEESPEAFLSSHAEALATPLAALETELADPAIHYLGAFNDHGLVGFMRYVRFSRHARQHVAEVRSVYVRRAQRGQGVARQLLQRLIDSARGAGIESLILSVLADNHPARRLYDSSGFQLYGVEPRAVRHGPHYQDQALYVLDLGRSGVSATPLDAGRTER
ncbi:GNAT family N-acetyltransferase [Stenotrophomonas mori]|uniref:GNAT family N-acetyltransferase n=1 Tax=Stenotrophomonas mori TaxID=2871096 RepID=A0ABT0SKD9_9GAMM|nr:GNAT family N-acetyltransferase [Stenotrophomonas mori]MCL7715800.1 GNAT family N-acetyltransferase [Stenotrophomonas mori]